MFFRWPWYKGDRYALPLRSVMRMGWKGFLPASLAMVAIVAGVLQYRDRVEMTENAA